MSITTTIFLIFIPLLSFILLTINFIFAPHNSYQEKNSAFECGFHSFLGQNRTQFTISFFIFALLFLIFDLEILLVYPYTVSAYTNELYGLITMLIFFIILTLGFAFELGKNALNLDSRQILSIVKNIYFILVRVSSIILLNCIIYILYCFLFFFTYIISSTIVVFILYKIGLIDLPFSQIASDISRPLFMNAEPLDCYPEYKQINNLQQIFNVKQHLFGIKRDIEIKLLFNKPECYKQIVDNLQGLYNNNKILLQEPSRLHSHISYGHQLDWMKDLENQIEYSKKEYIAKVEMFQQNSRNLAECNHRIQAVSTRISQLGGSNN